MLFLLTSENPDTKFVETLIDTTKIVTVRLLHTSDYKICIEDVNNHDFCARFNSEGTMRTRLADLLTAMGGDPSIANTMKVLVKPKRDREDISEKLADLIRSL